MKILVRKLLEVLFFFLVMFLSFYTIFKGQDVSVIWAEIQGIPLAYVCLIGVLALGYLVTEGVMFYILFHPLDKHATFLRCVNYSFVGFFYSSITPSASGGQPMQLYYMKKDGCSLSTCVLILICMGTVSRVALCLLGIGLLVFARSVFLPNLNSYATLFYIGYSMIVIWTIFLICLISITEPMEKLILKISRAIFKKRPAKSAKADDKIKSFFSKYNNSLSFFGAQPYRIFGVFLLALFQKTIPLFITVLVYRGLGITGPGAITIMIMQAAITLTVDMLPLPGGQGIYEAMYRSVFLNLVPATSIMSSLYVSRGVNFYYLLIVSGIIVAVNMVFEKIRRKAAGVAESDAEIVAGPENR